MASQDKITQIIFDRFGQTDRDLAYEIQKILKNNWISVYDMLPSDHTEVLVWPKPNRDHNILTASYNSKLDHWYQDMYNEYGFEDFYPNVTHWMPLPEPPNDNS